MVQDVKPGGIFMINCQWSDEELNEHMPAEAKQYIAKNNIQLYTINAIDKAIEIGMGKRTNTILQSAFFKLANVMPIDEAVEYMKAAAKKSYSKKGDAVVEMNYKAIDAGVDAVHKVEVPADWATAVDDKKPVERTGRPATVKMVNELLDPIGKMDGDSLPVSAFKEQVLLHTRREEQPLWFLSGIQQAVFSVTAVHSYVHTQLSDHSFLMLRNRQKLHHRLSLLILSMQQTQQ